MDHGAPHAIIGAFLTGEKEEGYGGPSSPFHDPEEGAQEMGGAPDLVWHAAHGSANVPGFPMFSRPG